MPRALIFALVLAAGITPAALQKKSKQERAEEAKVRLVEGAVRDPADQTVEGAVVQLKNIKTLQVRSFITRPDGTYYFHGLSREVDYEIKADHKGLSSGNRTLSVFDDRQKVVMNLKLEKK